MSLTQADLILEHMKAGKSITPIEALSEYGCFRLAARIQDLRKSGHVIKTTQILHTTTLSGRKLYFAQYWMPEAVKAKAA